ncbi:MAG TPA: hypothetical protein VNA69_23145 [Thermoanaerobaculia bacterium]|nr:hypothetical protein [Thermoanaerobaculia bacterium]
MSNSQETPEVPSPRDEAVRQIVASLEAMIHAQLPGFTHIPTDRSRRLPNVGAVSDGFLESVAVAVESEPNVGVPSEIAPEEVRDAIDSSRTFNSLADQLELAARGVRATVAERRASICKRALAAYGIAKHVNRHINPRQAHVASMRRALGRSGKKKALAQTPPATQPPVAPPQTEGGAAK